MCIALSTYILGNPGRGNLSANFGLSGRSFTSQPKPAFDPCRGLLAYSYCSELWQNRNTFAALRAAAILSEFMMGESLDVRDVTRLRFHKYLNVLNDGVKNPSLGSNSYEGRTYFLPQSDKLLRQPLLYVKGGFNPKSLPKPMMDQACQSVAQDKNAQIETPKIRNDSKEEDEEISSECDDSEYDEDGYPKIIVSANGLYEWGFKGAVFCDKAQDGVARFRELLSLFGLEEAPLEAYECEFLKFVWCSHKNNRSLRLVTTYNPITGQCGSFLNRRYPQVLNKGFLGFVGVESDSAELLRDFIQEFRERATSVKEESNGRVYV